MSSQPPPSSSSSSNNTNNNTNLPSTTTRPSSIPSSPSSSNNNNNNNMMMRSSPKPSGGMIPQYQQYFHLLQSMTSGSSLPIPSTSTSLNLSPNLSGLPTTSSSIGLVSTSPMMRRTTLSAILGTTPSGLTRSNPTALSTTTTTMTTSQNSSSKGNSGSASPKNENVSSTPMLVTSNAASTTLQNSSSQLSSPVPISSALPVKHVSSVVDDDGVTTTSSSMVLLDSSDSMPSPATAKQRKPRKKKEEDQVKIASATEDDASTSGGQTEDDASKKGRSKTCKRWTEEQNRLLKDAVLRYGPRNWKKIASEISGGMFTADQCNQHWHRVLHPRIIKGEWTQEEDNLLFDKVAEYGESSWTKVAEFLIGRTDIQCRHRYFQKKKEVETGSRRKSTSTFSSPSLASSTGASPSLGVTADGGMLSPQLAEGVRVNMPTPSPPLGISPSSILDSGSTSNFVHQHKITLFTTPSTVPLQERLKGDSSIILGPQQVLTSPNLQHSSSSGGGGGGGGTFSSPSLSMEPKQRVTQFSYLEKDGIDESDFKDDMMIMSSSTGTSHNFPKSQISIPHDEKKYTIPVPSQQEEISHKQPPYNENLLLCDEEDLSTPKLGTSGSEEDMSHHMKRATPQLVSTQQDDMDEDEEPHQLTIDEIDTTTSPELVKAKNLQKSIQVPPVQTNTSMSTTITTGSPQVVTTSGTSSSSSGGGGDHLNALNNNTPTITPAKPKKRSSALNRMRGNINVWIPFSESEEQVLLTEVYKQLLEKNVILPHQKLNFTNKGTNSPTDSIKHENASSSCTPHEGQLPPSSESNLVNVDIHEATTTPTTTTTTTTRQSILLPSPVPILMTSNSSIPRQLIPHNNHLRKTSENVTSTNHDDDDYVDDIDFVEILTVNSNCFHPLRTHHSLKTHFVKLREMLGDAALFNLSSQSLTPSSLLQDQPQGPVLEPLSHTPLVLYQKSNSHAWLSSSKVATHRTSSLTSTSSQSTAAAAATSHSAASATISSSPQATQPNKPGRKKKMVMSDATQVTTASMAEEGASRAPSSTGKPGRKRKTIPAAASTSTQLLSQPGVASSTMAEPTRKKVKKTPSAEAKHAKSEDVTSQPMTQVPAVADSNVTFLLLKNFNAPATTKQIQPSKTTLPLDTPLSQIISTIRGSLSLSYDPELYCESSLVSNTAQSLRNLMEEKNIRHDELVIFYK
ncbi:hypothetical protein C9374_006805 [Naegleria lovaniensis]|uniref:Myb transcription factor n=1 Tax=Naegleria lovaniensis TaxID=51637 RepID=A0AA88H433_NAELO|nr:uncharacterized protein C9374_006805 [Naegleria lovaniensis]KAG2393274.1 hypothetical protein C9374_006805 [Naegleria lovaniensis]